MRASPKKTAEKKGSDLLDKEKGSAESDKEPSCARDDVCGCRFGLGVTVVDS